MKQSKMKVKGNIDYAVAKLSLNNFTRGVQGGLVETRVLSSDESRTAVSTFETLKSIERDIEKTKLIEEAEARGIKLVKPNKRKLK